MKRSWFVLLVLVFSTGLFGQQVKSLEFRNQDIRDILLAFGELNGVSIVPDDTVDGRASYVFANMGFDEALQRFLESFHLVATKKDAVYRVSRVGVTVHGSDNFDLQTYETPLRSILQIVSSALSQAVLYDNIPNDPLTLNLKGLSLNDLLKIVSAKYPDFTIQKQDKYYYLRNTSASSSPQGFQNAAGITRTGDRYSLQIQKVRFRDAMTTIFQLANLQYVMVLDRDMILDGISLNDLSWEDALRTLLLFGNADFTVSQGIYYILEAQRRDLLKKYLVNVIVPFEYISSADFLKLLPSDLASGSNFKLDDKNNKVILTGSQEQINPIWDFLKVIDQPQTKNPLTRFDLNYLKTDDLFPLLPQDLANFNPQALPGKSSFLLAIPESRRGEVQTLLTLVDRPQLGAPIRLRFLKSDELIAKLPPSVTEANLARTNDPSLIFFKGTDAQRKVFLDDLTEIDVPRPQLRYEVLVLQFDEGKRLNWDSKAGVGPAASDEHNSLAGSFDKLMNISFDVVSSFGAHFALSLSASLSDNTSKVLADTTLMGLSGEKISFQNTQTVRYPDNQNNPDTGKYVTVIRDLPSGLMLGLEGWVSADNMITVKVDSTLSQAIASEQVGQGTPTPPSTFEKRISTTVRTPSGRALVLSGLKQDQVSATVNKVPLLGDIPWLGALFQLRTENVTRTEFSIYIVPVLERPEAQEAGEAFRLQSFYQRWLRVAP